MKFTDYKNFMIVSMGTALMLQTSTNFTFSIPDKVECKEYPNASLTMIGTIKYDVPKCEEYHDGYMMIAIYVDNYLPFYVNPNGK